MIAVLIYLLIAHGEIAPHDFHLSKCDINYSMEHGALRLSVHLFIDDLEAALALEDHHGLKLCTEGEPEHTEALVASYIRAHLQIMSNTGSLQMLWIGKEASEDLAGVWCYLEILGIDQNRRYEIENTLLLELFDDQKNIVKITSDQKKKEYLLLDHKERTGIFEL